MTDDAGACDADTSGGARDRLPKVSTAAWHGSCLAPETACAAMRISISTDADLVPLYERLAEARVKTVNRRREFFRATPMEVEAHLVELAAALLQFQELPEALEYRQCLAQSTSVAAT